MLRLNDEANASLCPPISRIEVSHEVFKHELACAAAAVNTALARKVSNQLEVVPIHA
ncbi:hypothetical protein EMIT093MI4_80175 [Pseudomonas sp. IT-93MI4]